MTCSKNRNLVGGDLCCKPSVRAAASVSNILFTMGVKPHVVKNTLAYGSGVGYA